MKQVALCIIISLMVGCNKQKNKPSKVKEANRVAKTTQKPILPDTTSKKLNYPAITGLWENREYLLNLKKYNSITKTDSLADFYTHLFYEGDSLLYGNKRDLMEEAYFLVVPDNQVLDFARKPVFTIKAFTDSTLEIQLKATNKIEKYTKVLPLVDIRGKVASSVFSDQLNLLTNKWFAGNYKILFSGSTRAELTFRIDGILLGYPKYTKYVLFSSKGKDVLSLSGNTKASPGAIFEMLPDSDTIRLFELKPIDDIDDPLIRTGKNFILVKF